MSTIGKVVKTAGKVLSTASNIKKGVNDAKKKKQEELAQVKSGQVAKDNAIVSPVLNQNTVNQNNGVSTLAKTVGTFMEANKAKNTKGGNVTITNTHVDPNAVYTPETNQSIDQTKLASFNGETPTTTQATATPTTTAPVEEEKPATEEKKTGDWDNLTGDDIARLSSMYPGMSIKDAYLRDQELQKKSASGTTVEETTKEEEKPATEDETIAEEKANEEETKSTTTTTTDDGVVEEKTREETLKATYGYNPETLQNDVNLMNTTGFSGMTTGQIGNIAKACALGGLSAKDAMEYMTKMAVIPNSIKQQIYDECGLTALEREFIENPSLTEQNLYNAYYEEMGLGKIKEEIRGLTAERDREIAKYNENPFLVKTVRNNYTNNIAAQYNNKIEQLQDDYKNGIDKIDEKIQGYMKYGMQKLEYMQKKAEDYIDGLKPTYESAILSLFMPEYSEYKSIQAEEDLAKDYEKNASLTEVTGLMTPEQLVNLVNNGGVVKEANGRTWINVSSMPSWLTTNRDEFGNVTVSSKGGFLSGVTGTTGDTNLYNAGMNALTGYNGTTTQSTITGNGHIINTGNGQVYNDEKWATDQNHSNAVNNATNQIKKYNGDYEQFFKDKFGTTVYSNQDILNASAEAGIDPDLLAGMITVETSGGTNLAKSSAKYNNPAGLSARADGSVPQWIQELGGTVGGGRAEGGRYIKFQTPQDGLLATAKLIKTYSTGELSNKAQTGTDEYSYVVSNNSNLRNLSRSEFERAKEKALNGENLSTETKTETDRRIQEAALDYLRYMSENDIKIKPSDKIQTTYQTIKDITEPGMYTEKELHKAWDAVTGKSSQVGAVASLAMLTLGTKEYECAQRIVTLMNSLSSESMLNALIDAKSRNAVFGQLSDNEGKSIKDSSEFSAQTGWDNKKNRTTADENIVRNFMINYGKRLGDKYVLSESTTQTDMINNKL